MRVTNSTRVIGWLLDLMIGGGLGWLSVLVTHAVLFNPEPVYKNYLRVDPTISDRLNYALSQWQTTPGWFYGMAAVGWFVFIAIGFGITVMIWLRRETEVSHG